MGGGSQDLLTSIDEDQRRPLFAGLFLPIRVPGSTRVFAGHVHEKGGADPANALEGRAGRCRDVSAHFQTQGQADTFGRMRDVSYGMPGGLDHSV